MKIDLTKKQYECLIKALEAADSVYGILGDSMPEDYKKQSDQIDDLRKYLLGFASEFSAEYMIEKFHGEIIMSDELSESLQEVMNDYDNETFWHELETRLGKRDFDRTITEAENKEMEENNGWYSNRIYGIYEAWSNEFEENGIERLGIIKEN